MLRSFLKSNLYYLLAAAALLAAAGGLAYYYWPNIVGKSAPVSSSQSSAPPKLSLRAAEAQSQIQAGEMSVYDNPAFGFSFSYPASFKIGESADEAGETILVQKEGAGFQLYVSPFDEDIALTPERIKQDVPEIKMEEPLVIAVNGTQAVTFLDASDTPATRQIWWVRAGSLYQITTYREFDEVMVEILKTWKWE